VISCWRLCDARFEATALTGEGAALVGGRWNSPGRRVVYASESRALALLEQLVHFDVDLMPRTLIAVTIMIPDGLDTARMPSPDDGGRGFLDQSDTRAFGDEWLAQRETVALAVPSAVVSQESNYLLNPEHPSFASVLHRAEPFWIDPRLLRSRLR
jgi:RES domain-containing protein